MWWKRHKQAKEGRKERKDRTTVVGGFTGLEGDFEAERRRAAAAAHERIEPYEDDGVDKPKFPDATSGLTHP